MHDLISTETQTSEHRRTQAHKDETESARIKTSKLQTQQTETEHKTVTVCAKKTITRCFRNAARFNMCMLSREQAWHTQVFHKSLNEYTMSHC